jgi:hypothetical protein
MRHVLLVLAFIFIPQAAFSFGALNCGGPIGNVHCFAATNFDTDPDATSQAFAACVEQFGAEDCKSPTFRFANECESAACRPAAPLHFMPEVSQKRDDSHSKCVIAPTRYSRVGLL